MMRLAIAIGVLILLAGCGLVPQIQHQPTLHNPFPQLTKVAVAPFFNLSTEGTVDPRQFGLAYAAELQAVPGYEVVPIGTVEAAIRDNRLSLNSAADCRRLAQLLDVDAVVIGAVTDFSPYYPPRLGLQVEWYAANPCFHQIPTGYGLPWGTPAEEDIPPSLVLESEMALAREQLATQTPDYPKNTDVPLPAERGKRGDGIRMASHETPASDAKAQPIGATRTTAQANAGGVNGAGAGGAAADAGPGATGKTAARSVLVRGPDINPLAAGMPPNWPSPSGFIPPGPSCVRPDCHPSNEPVMRHTRIYHGADPEFTAALQHYYDFRDDARFGGWTAYLQRSDDFIRFCCHKHIAEMLSARGGAGETKIVWRWPESR